MSCTEATASLATSFGTRLINDSFHHARHNEPAVPTPHETAAAATAADANLGTDDDALRQAATNRSIFRSAGNSADDVAFGEPGEQPLLDSDAPAAPVSCLDDLRQLKWRAHIFICLITIGNYYTFDFPGAIGTGKQGTIEHRFMLHGKKYNQEMNQALYSVYSWPNTILAFFGGLLIDKFLGLRRATVLFMILVCTGSWVFYLGVQTLQYPLMLLGRFLFGLGGESLSVAQSSYVARWFSKGGLSLAFGITITVCRVASTANFFFSPRIACDYGVEFAVMIGGFATALSLVASVFLAAIDKYGTKTGAVPELTQEAAGEPMRLRDVTKLPLSAWLLGAICAFVYCSIFPFVAIARNFFTVVYGLGGDTGSSMVSIYQLASAIASPPFGGVVDKTGRLAQWMIGACFCFAGVHLVFLCTTAVPAYVMMAVMGAVYGALVSSMWPAMPYLVHASRVGIAYGLMTSVQNTGLAIFPLMTGAVLDVYTPSGMAHPGGNHSSHNGTSHDHHHDGARYIVGVGAPVAPLSNASSNHSAGAALAPLPTHNGYMWTETIFFVSALISAGFAIALYRREKKRHGCVHLPSAEGRALLDMRHADEEHALLAAQKDGRPALESKMSMSTLNDAV